MHKIDSSNSIEKNDSILWDNLRKGDKKSIEKIYRENVTTLYRYGLRFVNDKEFILDCIQEVFIDLLLHKNSLGETNNIRFYLFICLKHKIIRVLHKKNLEQPFTNEEFRLFSLIEEIPDEFYDLDVEKNLAEAMELLTPRQKEAIYLRFVSGFKYEEICSILNMNYQSVRNLIHRGIEKMRKILVQSKYIDK